MIGWQVNSSQSFWSIDFFNQSERLVSDFRAIFQSKFSLIDWKIFHSFQRVKFSIVWIKRVLYVGLTPIQTLTILKDIDFNPFLAIQKYRAPAVQLYIYIGDCCLISRAGSIPAGELWCCIFATGSSYIVNILDWTLDWIGLWAGFWFGLWTELWSGLWTGLNLKYFKTGFSIA